MPYVTEHLTRLEHFKIFAVSVRTLIQALEARQDSDVTAATEDSEIIDARVDAWGNIQGSLGSNIRGGQSRLIEALRQAQSLLQEQIDALSETRITNTLDIAEEAETRRRELAAEEEYRIRDDDSLQRQINSLSEAVIDIALTLSELRERQTGGNE